MSSQNHPRRDPHPRGVVFWTSALVGWAVIVIAVHGAFQHRIDTRPASLTRFLIGSALAHDLVVAPVVLGIGLVVARLVPRQLRAVAQAGLVIGGVVTLYAFPLVRAYGRALHNPTSLPRNYGMELAIVLTLLWSFLAMVVVIRRLRSRTRAARERQARQSSTE